MSMNGIDIASYQGTLSPTKVEADFIIIKATQGTGYLNPYFEAQANETLKAGKLLGIYHYANGGGVQGEVSWFLRNVQKYIGKAVLCLDWEHIPGAGPNSQFYNPQYARQFMDEVKKRTGVTMVIYGSKDSCFNAMNWSSVASDGYKLWGAQYASNNKQWGYNANPWQSNRPWGAWGNDLTIFQYTSNLRLAEYAGALDGDIAYIDRMQWSVLAGSVITPIPSQQPTETNIAKMSLLDLIIGVQEDKYGKRTARKKALGARYEEVQNAINHIYSASADTLAKEVWTGKYGDGETRKRALDERYDEVQEAVERLAKKQKSIHEIAQEVIADKWGVDPMRTKNLRAAGYDSVAVQKEVNRILGVNA